MPQIKVYLNTKALSMITEDKFDNLKIWLTYAVERAFEIEGKDDVAFNIISVLYTSNESPVQIEVIYTAGEDEYNTGSIFDPTETEKDIAILEITASFSNFLLNHRMVALTPSVWIRPQYKSRFRAGSRD